MRRLIYTALAVLVTSLVLTPAAMAELRYRQGPTPGWVTSVETPTQWANQSSPRELAGQAVHYRLVDQQTYVDTNGKYHRFRHYVERPLTQDGLQSSGAIEIFFKPDYQQVTLHHFTIIRDGVATDRLADARISVLDVEPESDNNLYSGEAKVLVLVPDFRLGDSIDYQYTISGRNPVFGHKVSPGFSLGWGVPVERVYRRFTLPAGRTVQFRTENISVEPVISQGPLGQSYTVQLDKTPVYTEDPDAPGDSNIYPSISFSEFDSWEAVGQWAKPLFEYTAPTSNATWQQWLADINQQTNTEAKITYALQLVQNNIRYVGIEMGENSHRPHPPSETLALAYGDCKDKTLLLVSLLTAAGIEAEPFLVNTKSTAALAQWLPSAYAFNHVITRVKVKNQIHYIDPTLSYQAGRQLSDLGYHDYKFGLPVSSGEGLVAMPARTVTRPAIETTQEFQGYDYTLPVLLTSTASYYNEQADYQRYRYANTALADLERNYIDFYTREYGTTTVARRLTFNDNQDDNVFSISVQLWVDNFYQYDADENQFEYDVYAYLPDEYLTLPDRIARTQPYKVANPSYVSQNITVRHPRTYNPTGLTPSQTEIKNDVFTFEVSSFDFADQSRYQFRYRNHQETVAAEKMSQYADDIREARQHLSYTGWFNNVIAPDTSTQAREFFNQWIGHQLAKEASF